MEEEWMGTLGLSVGYFVQPFVELEGSFGIMRIWDGNYSTTMAMGTGKLALNYVTQKTATAVPYAFGGVGLAYAGSGNDWYSESETDTLVTFGGGVKAPLGIIRRLALRVEYSYTRCVSCEGEGEPIHAVSIGLSAFL